MVQSNWTALEVEPNNDARVDEISGPNVTSPNMLGVCQWILIQESGRENYTTVKSRTMITAPGCMAEAVSEIVSELWSDEAERRELLSDRHHGSRKNRSAIDTAAIIVESACWAYKEDNITGVLLMDVNTAFQNVVRGRQIHAVNAKLMDQDLIRCTKSFHSHSMVEMHIERNALLSHLIEAGIPQGSPVLLNHLTIPTSGLLK